MLLHQLRNQPQMPEVHELCTNTYTTLQATYARHAVRSLFRLSASKAGQDWSVHSPRSVNIPAFSDDNSAPRYTLTGELWTANHALLPLFS